MVRTEEREARRQADRAAVANPAGRAITRTGDVQRRKPRYNLNTVVGVAQLVEPRVVIPVVVGSSPIVHPTFFKVWGL